MVENWVTWIISWLPELLWLTFKKEICFFYNEVVGGYIGFTPSVRPSVCPACRVRSVTSTVLDGFFPYLIQMITSMRRCVACDDLWPWPISSRSFGLDLENRVRSVASTVRNGFFLYLAQMITIIRGCVACYVFFRIWKLEFFSNFSALTLKKKIYSSRSILSIYSTNDHWYERVCCI